MSHFEAELRRQNEEAFVRQDQANREASKLAAADAVERQRRRRRDLLLRRSPSKS